MGGGSWSVCVVWDVSSYISFADEESSRSDEEPGGCQPDETRLLLQPLEDGMQDADGMEGNGEPTSPASSGSPASPCIRKMTSEDMLVFAIKRSVACGYPLHSLWVVLWHCSALGLGCTLLWYTHTGARALLRD